MEVKNKKILVVDDSLTVRMQIKDLLEDEGYLVMLSQDGEACLETLESERPDIILLDIIMPGMSGLDVCKAIKGDDRLRDIPVLILTHVSDVENKVAGLRIGAEDYVTKPFAIEELNARIFAILKTKSLKEELRLARDAAEQSTKAKANFLANMSHEIRTPMNGVIGLTELLLETDLDNEQKEYVKTIKRSGDSLLVVINDILDFSKMETEDIPFENIAFDVDQLLYDVCNLIRPKLGEKPVQVSYSIDPDVPKFFLGDPHRLRQILLNILGNSAKFTKRGKIVSTLGLEKKEGCKAFLHFRLKDTGVGIPKDKLETIFEIFTQADVSTTREFGGTGLGLSIARKIARQIGGNCWAESDLGKGSTFHITGWFGVGDNVVGSQEPDSMSDHPDDSMEERSLRVLLAEDNPVNQMVAKKMIKKIGHTVEIAGNGKIALEMYRKTIARHEGTRTDNSQQNDQDSSYDIIFMDMQMPEMDGVEVAKEIRKLEAMFPAETNGDKKHTSHIPIIAMTANVLEEHRDQCLSAGMDDFIAKPIKKDVIAGMIRKWVSY